MATLIQAFAEFGPRIRTPKTIGLDILSTRLIHGSLVTRSIARMVLEDLSDAVLVGLREGNAVQLPGIGRFGVALSMDGEVRPTFRTDHQFRRSLPSLSEFPGTVIRRENVGLTALEIAALWDAAHPEDPIELPPRFREAA